MSQDLILSVVKDRQWYPSLDCYAISLYKTGYAGRKVMFVENVSMESRVKLQDYGFEVYSFTTPSNNRLHFQTYRYEIAYKYLEANWQHFRYVMWTDVTDLVFQTDPMIWIEKNITSQTRLIAAKEGRLIKNEGINKVWIERLRLPEHVKNHLMEQEVLCSGTIQGLSGSVLGLFHKMKEQFGINDMRGIDQGIYNWAIRESFSGTTYVPEMSEGFITTCGMFLAKGNDPAVWTVEPPYFDRETGLVMTSDRSKSFSVVHGYDRNYSPLDPDGSWRGILERRYR